MDSSSLSHTRYKCQYHIVFIPKYRKRIMYGRLKADVREIIKKLCDYRNIEIVEGAVCADHVHLCLSIPPSEKVSDVVGYIKGKSALMIRRIFMIEAVAVLLFFIVAGTLWGIIETFKYRKFFSRDCENGQISTIKAYRIKRRGSWRIFGDRILDEKSFLVMREKESKLKIH